MSEQPAVIALRKLRRGDRERAGAKAANLGELAAAGLPVPDGFAVVGEPGDEVLRAAEALGGGPLAVRSSAVAEDLAGASFAGQYETVLDVRGDDQLLAAIRRCRESALGERVEGYRAGRALAGDRRIAVLVQRMVLPEAAGVAFTADPVTGERDRVVITAARGLGERVVGGEAVGDEWLVIGGAAICRRSTESAIDADQAAAIAGLARRTAEVFGEPQDVEWAIAGGRPVVLQARPMTALPEPVRWDPPAGGFWMRDLRLGEWLSEPMTPLFEDWLLARLEEGVALGMRRTAGTSLPWPRAAINGWYYTGPPHPTPRLLARAALESRGRVFGFVLNVLVRVGTRPEVADRRLLGRLAAQWRGELLPAYRELVADGERRLPHATPSELSAIVDRVGLAAGEQLWSLWVVGGSAWKMEGALARFCRRHLAAAGLPGNPQALLRGLSGMEPQVGAHAVQSIDWYHPTAGELGLAQAGWIGPGRDRVAAEREETEARCRAALAGSPRLLTRFETTLAVARRYATLREEQARELTLGWPLLRRCALGIGARLRDAGAIDRPEDVFFLVGHELGTAAGERLQPAVAARRARWERWRRLSAPLTIGRAPRLLRAALDATVEAVRTGGDRPEGAIVGDPASPGRAAGPVRVVHGPDDFARFQAGEVLVAKGTAPAWTPLFARAAAVVTDGGSLAAHASLVAREYGIPAVVGTGDATVRLRDGQRVVVDGGAGLVVPDRPAGPG